MNKIICFRLSVHILWLLTTLLSVDIVVFQVYHTFHDEVDNYRQHWWRCDGPCQSRPPYFGYVKRSMNRAPSPRDPWWPVHQQSCGGTYSKVKEPEGYGIKKKAEKEEKKMGMELIMCAVILLWHCSCFSILSKLLLGFRGIEMDLNRDWIMALWVSCMICANLYQKIANQKNFTYHHFHLFNYRSLVSVAQAICGYILYIFLKRKI